MGSFDSHYLHKHTSFRGMQLPYGPGALQFGTLYLPDSAGLHPIVILIHGGYWRARYGLGLMVGLAEDLAARGIAAWNIEYRRVGDKGGGWPGTLQDVARATDYLRVLAPVYNLNLQQVVPIGHSAGGHLALWLAARPKIVQDSVIAGSFGKETEVNEPLPLAGAISLAGVVDLRLAWQLNLSNGAVIDLLGGDFNAVPERYTVASPAAMLPLGVPQVLIHGTRDDSVPLQVSQAYLAAAKAVDDQVTLIELPGVDHFAVIDPSSTAWIRTLEALQQLLDRRDHA